MADPVQPIQPSVQQEQPVAPVAAQPVPQEPVASQVAPPPSPEPSVSPAPAATPEAAAPAAEAKPAELIPSLLQEFDKDAAAKAKPSDKPVEPGKDATAPDAVKPDAKDAAKPVAEAKPAEAAKPAEESKPAEAAKPAEPAPLAPVEYKYELPATLKMDDALKGEVHTLLDNFRADPAKNVQSLVDFHAKSMTDYASKLQTDLLKAQFDTFNETRKGWQTEVKADDEIGGAGHQTAMGAVARMRDLVADDMMTPRKWDDGSPRKSQLDEFLETTGAGDHPVFLKMMHRFARFFDEASPPPPNPQPLPNGGQRPKSRMKDLYADGPQKSS